MVGTKRVLVRSGFFLFLLALLTGLAIPLFLNPRLAMAAHVTGLLNALVLIAVGFAWNKLALERIPRRITVAAFLYGTYANWVGSCLGAAWGTKRLTPISGGDYNAAPWQENVVMVILLSMALAMIIGTILVVYGLRSTYKMPRDE